MSPFEDVVDGLAERIDGLPAPAQAALFLAGARALDAGRRAWASAAGRGDRDDVFDAGCSAAEAAVRRPGTAVDPTLLAAVDATTPHGPTDVDGFTAAQDCWICLGTALTAARGDGGAAGSTWYLLEPLLQATSERLFGATDVGSQDEEAGEAAVLADP